MQSQQAIRTGLVALPNHPVHLKHLANPVQTAIEVRAEPHQVLHVENPIPEEHPHERQEIHQPLRQRAAREELHQVPEVVRAVERDPRHAVVADEPWRHHQLPEPLRVDAGLPIPIEVDALAAEELHRVVRVGVTRHVEIAEIELPDEGGFGGSEAGEVAVGVGEGEADLDEVEAIDVGLEDGVVGGG